jgi:3-isopropylmalate dehydrogenase
MKLLALPGDGIGPEIMAATLTVLRAADAAHGIGLEIEEMEIGLAALARAGTTLPDAVLERIPAVDGVILGPVSHYEYPPRPAGGINPSGELRARFALGANIRPARSRPGLSLLGDRMDLVIVREATEGFYADRNMHAGPGEFMPDPDTALSVRKITAAASRRVAEAAFALALERRRRVTAIHKANVLKLSDGLFLREVRDVARAFPGVVLDEMIVDAAAAQLIRAPERFDVIVTTNMFGDILSDEASELSGGLGLGGAINVGDGICVAQAQHGSAPDIQGLGVANPISLSLSAAMLLDWRGRRDRVLPLRSAARHLQHSVDHVLANPETRTRDLGGTCSTAELTGHLVAALRVLDA